MAELESRGSEEILHPVFIILDEETAQHRLEHPAALSVFYQSGRQVSQAFKTGMRPDAYLIDAAKKVARRTIPNTVADLVELTNAREVTVKGGR